MTEKRFTLAYEKGNWWAVRDGDITLWKEEVISLLNDFHEEKEQLEKENEQLKKELNNFRPLYFKSEDGCVTLYEKVINDEE